MIDLIRNNKKAVLFYEIGISILAIIAVSMAVMDIIGSISIESSNTLHSIDIGILLIFSIDYFVRLFISKAKPRFIKENIFDLLAIIPFNTLFRAFRIFRVFRIAKLAKITKISKATRFLALLLRAYKKTNKFFSTNGLNYVMLITFVTMVLGSVLIFIVERGYTIETFGDALWWSFVTTTTVGYGDISPATSVGRIIASFLMLVGIGFLSMLTGTVATYFVKSRNEDSSDKEVHLIDISMLSGDEQNNVLSYVEFLKNN